MKNLFLYGALAASLASVSTLSPVRAQGMLAPASPNTFDGKVRVVKGAKYNMRVFVRSKVTQELPDSVQVKKLGFKKTESLSIMKFDVDYDIVSVDAQGNHQVRVTYGDFLMDVDASVDGKTRPPKVKAAAKKATDEYLKGMKGESFLIKLSPTNQVFAVYGLDAMRARLLQKLETIAPGARAIAEPVLAGFLSDKNAAKNFGKLGGELPSQPMRVSESWNYSTTSDSSAETLLTPTIEGVRTLVSLTGGIATIKDVGTFSLDSSADGKPFTKPKVNVTGTQTAITHINNATGIPLDATATQIMNGTMDLPMGENGKSIQLNLSSVNNFRFVMEQE